MIDKKKNGHIKLPHKHGEGGQAIVDRMPEELAFARGSDMFSLLSDMSRLKIFWILCHCEECVINIAAALEMSSPAVSHHLKLLKNAGYLISRKEGKEVYYSLAKTEDAKKLHLLVDTFFEKKNCEII